MASIRIQSGEKQYLLLAGDADGAVEVDADDELFVGERRERDFAVECLGELQKKGLYIKSLTSQ